MGHLEMVNLLLNRGADIERVGHYVTALGFAVHGRQLDVVQLLLRSECYSMGAHRLHSADLLYIAMGLRPCQDGGVDHRARRTQGRNGKAYR